MKTRCRVTKDPTYTISVQEGRQTVAVVQMTVMKDRRGRRYGYVREVYTDPAHRGSGHGTALNRAAIAKARELKCYKIVLTTRFDNEGAQRLYGRLGYKQHGYEYRLDLEKESG